LFIITLQWIENNGGIEAAEERNNAKAKLIYDEIDSNPILNVSLFQKIEVQ
jgi:phosphoserine aminotransferase